MATLQDHIDNIYRAFGLDPKDFTVPRGREQYALDHHLANITALLAQLVSGGGSSGGGGNSTGNTDEEYPGSVRIVPGSYGLYEWNQQTGQRGMSLDTPPVVNGIYYLYLPRLGGNSYSGEIVRWSGNRDVFELMSPNGEWSWIVKCIWVEH